MRSLSPHVAGLVVGVASSLLLGGSAAALPPGIPDEMSIPAQIGPLINGPSARTAISFNRASRKKQRVFDATDRDTHVVVGVPLRTLLDALAAPKEADAFVLRFKNGMRITVARNDAKLIDDLFVAFEYSPAFDEYELTYRVNTGAKIACPHVVYQARQEAYSPFRYADTLDLVQAVTRRAYEAELAQPTREQPTTPGWKLFLQHCSSCHGLGGQGASLAPDFVSDVDAYRRIPALTATAPDQPPSLHEKVRGVVDGRMPQLKHIPDRDIVTIWRWLHTIHRGATK